MASFAGAGSEYVILQCELFLQQFNRQRNSCFKSASTICDLIDFSNKFLVFTFVSFKQAKIK